MEMSMQPKPFKRFNLLRTARLQDEHLKDLSGTSKTKVESLLNMPYLSITRTCSVNNTHMRAMYELKVAEYAAKHGAAVEEQTMFYTTNAKHAYHVAKYNFNWRETRKGNLGNGVAFSPDAEYSNYLCARPAKDMAVIVVKVLMVKSCRGYSFMDFPSGDCDTTQDQRGRVFVKFHDNEFLPVHVVFFDLPGTRNNQNGQRAATAKVNQTNKDFAGCLELKVTDLKVTTDSIGL